MAPSFEALVQSPQFTFFIGKEKKPITVHAAAIAATSDPMNVLINGEMNEANAKCAFIDNVEVEDFIRFCEYAYRGDFTVPSPVEDKTYKSQDSNDADTSELFSIHVLAAPEPVPEPEPEPVPEIVDEVHMEEDSWGGLGASVSKKKKKNKGAIVYSQLSQLDLRTKRNNRNYLSSGDPKADILDRVNPLFNTKSSQDFTPIFLAYGRLYTFANMRLIGPLKALTLHKLHTTLLCFELYVRRVGDVVELARYAYDREHTPDRDDDGTLDKLRELVVEYIVIEIETIAKCKEFEELMEDGGEFVVDFLRICRKYHIQLQ